MGLLGSVGKGALSGAGIGGPWGALVGGGLGLVGSLFGNKGKRKQAENQRKAQIAGLNLQQNMGEDKRLSRLNLAQSILGKINSNSPAYGGRLNFNTAIDPAVLADLKKRRSYDFAPTVGDPNAGAGYDLLGSLFGGAGDLLSEADLGRSMGSGSQDQMLNGSTDLMSGVAVPPPPYDPKRRG